MIIKEFENCRCLFRQIFEKFELQTFIKKIVAMYY